MSKLKAYKVTDSQSDINYIAFAFAENPNIAKQIVIGTDGFEYSNYVDMRAERIPKLDNSYRGHELMDFYFDQQDMEDIVRNFGALCYEENGTLDTSNCDTCFCKEFCHDYKDYLSESEEN